MGMAVTAINTGLSEIVSMLKVLCSLAASHIFSCFLNLQMVAHKSFPSLKPVKLFTLNMHLVRSLKRFS
jgi:Na+/H+-dicarboxylate symporter